MLIWEGDRKLYEEEIPAPPIVHIISTQRDTEGVILRWEVEKSGSVRTNSCCLWYNSALVGPRCGRLARPRSAPTGNLPVNPRRYFELSPNLEIRVLATSGIATSITETTIILDDIGPSSPRLQLGFVGSVTEIKPVSLPNVVQSLITDSLGRQIIADQSA
jgi:hypothetical protein